MTIKLIYHEKAQNSSLRRHCREMQERHNPIFIMLRLYGIRTKHICQLPEYNSRKNFGNSSESRRYSFSVKTNDVNLRQKVNADLQNQPIEKVLETIFQNQPVSFEIEGKMVRIIKAPEKIRNKQEAQPKAKISGRVTDKQGEPLIGVSIIAKGANKGTITNIDGYYSLTVPDKSVIQFSYVGYDTQELKLGKGNILNATLQEKINDLDEVVVIGYGSMKKVT